jgi:predicted MPP superfamily phosphohydrolase
VRSALWPAAFDGLRIGHVSDFHLGDLLPLERALQVVERLAEQQPDLVACTGDVVDLHVDEAPELLAALANVGAPLGSALVLGNHDELHCPDAISTMASHAGCILLRNEAVQYARGEGKLIVAGLDWSRSEAGCRRLLDLTCGDDASHLLLAHNPRAFRRASEMGVALTLAGHTHGGQVALRNRPAANLAAARRHTAGLYEKGASRLYVTAGVGAWFPLRLNCPAEIAMLTMRHDADAGGRERRSPRRKPKRR